MHGMYVKIMKIPKLCFTYTAVTDFVNSLEMVF